MCVALMLVSGGCTRNNGNIGAWFGTWHLEAIEADGVADVDYAGNIFWSFQNDVLQLTRVPVGDPGNHEAERRFGTWTEHGDVMELCFAYKSDSDPEGWEYHPFEVLHMPYGGVSSLRIVKQPAGETVLSYTSEEGTVYVYKLKKQG